ncbi:MAG: hypothetical protein AAF961_18690 [Planctomycetota bacterium]
MLPPLSDAGPDWSLPPRFTFSKHVAGERRRKIPQSTRDANWSAETVELTQDDELLAFSQFSLLDPSQRLYRRASPTINAAQMRKRSANDVPKLRAILYCGEIFP